MLRQDLQQRLQQKLSPQQIQFIKLLQLNTADFEERIEQEKMENPALDDSTDDPDSVEITELKSGPDETQNASGEGEGGEEFEEPAEDPFDISDYTENQDYDSFKMGDDITDDEEQKELPIATTKTFHELLIEQLSSINLDEHDNLLATYIVGSIDEDGYLRRPLAAMVNDMAFTVNLETNVVELERLLKIVQNLDPPGVGARDLQECLLLQLKRKKNDQVEVKLATRIITEYMEEFSKKHYDKLMKRLDINIDQLKKTIELISHLNPRPGEAQSDSKTQYIIPDFFVTNENGKLSVSLNSRNTPELRISRAYHETLLGFEKEKNPSREKKESVQFIKQKLDGAKWFIDSVKQRQNTLMNTMKAIVKYQHEYFLDGDETKLKPMILKDIADEVGLDISTISRVANSKYVETDFGIIGLKSFFSEGIATEEGDEVSNREVKKILADCMSALLKK